MEDYLHSNKFSRRSVLRGASVVAAATSALASADVVTATPVRREVEVEMSDGITIRGQLYYPSNSNGGIADEAGPFPVIATFNPYVQESDETRSTPIGGSEGITPGGTAAFVNRGYIRAEFETRGTGGSDGRFRGGDPREQKDYAELIHWLADLPRSTGKVGLYGASYMGMTQFFAVRGLERIDDSVRTTQSPLAALFPIVTGVEVYRNVLFNGGMYPLWTPTWMSSTWGRPLASGLLAADDMSAEETVDTTQAHVAGAYEDGISPVVGSNLGTKHAYRGEYWKKRSMELAFPAIIERDIPVFTIQGWHDIFQPGAAYIYTQLQNLWAGRNQFGPMDVDQPVSGRYQCAIGNYYHVSAKNSVHWAQLWFDRFLKNNQNGIDKTATPLHLFEVFGDQWIDAQTWPLPDFGGRRVATFYLNPGRTSTANHSLNDGALRQSKPAASDANDTLPWRLHNPCHEGTKEENLLGLGADTRCTDSGRLFEAGTLTYTTPTFDDVHHIAGPISLSLFASTDTTNTSWAVMLNDIAPDGTSTMISKGQLLGSLRALNEDRSWVIKDDSETKPKEHKGTYSQASKASDEGRLLRPLHPFTQASEQLVEPGTIERYDIFMDPVFARIRPGHRLRLAVRTNASWAIPLAKDLNDVIGTYQVQRSRDDASFINIPLISGSVPESKTDWGP